MLIKKLSSIASKEIGKVQAAIVLLLFTVILLSVVLFGCGSNPESTRPTGMNYPVYPVCCYVQSTRGLVLADPKFCTEYGTGYVMRCI